MRSSGTGRAGGRVRAAVVAAVIAAAALVVAPVPGGPAVALADAGYDDIFDEELDAAPLGYPDPIERFNRGILAFNQALDTVVIDPVTRLYRFVVPSVARDSVRRAVLNVGSVQILMNDFFQLRPACARNTFFRFLINTTLGVGGLMDVAAAGGMPRHEADFGQTMAIAGAPSGIYLVLPLLGPTNVRDGFGAVVDVMWHPVTYVLAPMQSLTYGSGAGLTARDDVYEALQALKESSVDYYSSLRNAYYQSRVGFLAAEPDCGCGPVEAAATP
jgi:phospholipid-binding lipoprotein MlaA